jgi:hypothetical protein
MQMTFHFSNLYRFRNKRHISPEFMRRLVNKKHNDVIKRPLLLNVVKLNNKPINFPGFQEKYNVDINYFPHLNYLLSYGRRKPSIQRIG